MLRHSRFAAFVFSSDRRPWRDGQESGDAIVYGETQMGTVLAMVGLLCVLASAVCGIIILIAAFQEDVTQGLLSLCVPF